MLASINRIACFESKSFPRLTKSKRVRIRKHKKLKQEK